MPLAERHRYLRSLARLLYRLPGLKAGTHSVVRFLLNRFSLPLGIRERLYNFFAEDTAPEGTVPTEILSPQNKPLRVELDLSDWLSRMWYYQGYNGYEPGTARLFSQLLRNASCVFDIGANVGYYTLLAAQQLEGRGELHSFEPFPPAFQRLSRNVQLNGFNCVRLNPDAVSDRDGTASLFLPQDGSWTTPSLVAGFMPQEKRLDVRTVRLDTYCKENGIRKVALIKIDAEGHSLAVLRGMGSFLLELKPDLILEVLSSEERSMRDFFSGTGYRKFLITPSGLEERQALSGHPHLRDYYLRWGPL